jgi:hypothetical protein
MLGLGLDMFSMLWTLPFRSLGAQDSFFKVLNNGMELAAQASRQVAEEMERGDLTPDQAKARYRELRDNPTEAMRIASKDFAEWNTFTNPPGPITRKWEQWRQWNNPYATATTHIMFPFTRTPGNLAAYSFLDHTPLARATDKYKADMAAGGARADMALAKMGMGTILLTIAFQMAMDGMITGGGPEEPEKRRAWMQSGWRPFSLRIPNGTNPDGSPRYVFVPINRLDPVASIPLLGAELAETLTARGGRIDETWERAWTAATFSIAEIAMNKPTMMGLSNIMHALVEPTRFTHTYAQRTAASFVPAGAAYIANRQDPVMRSTWDIMSAMKARTPGLSQSLPPQLDFWGRERTRQSGLGDWFDALSPLFARTNEAAQPIDRELGRLNYYPSHPRTLSVMRSEAAARALEQAPSQRRGRGLDALIAGAPDDPVRGESNVVPLRGLPQVQNRLISLTAATPASTLLRDNEEHLVAGRRRDVIPRLAQYGDKTLLEVLNDLVTNDPEYRLARDDHKLQAIRDVVADYRTAARAQVVREFPELQQRRDRMPTRAERARPVPY